MDAYVFNIKNITGDDNCFYRTISYYYRDNEEEYKDFRNLITEYKENNKAIFYDFITEQDLDIEYKDYNEIEINKKRNEYMTNYLKKARKEIT